MRGREIYSGTDPCKVANSKISIYAKKGGKLQYFASFFVEKCYLTYSIIIVIFGWKWCSKFNSIAVFLTQAKFAAFPDHISMCLYSV